jgi:hypothetical protein
VNPALIQRQAALAAGALVATLGVLALGAPDEQPSEPLPTPGVAVRWERGVVGILAPDAYAHETSCGVELDSGTVGVAHPLLPCGVDLILAHGHKEIRTEVVERGPVPRGRDFELTRALADELGVERTEAIRWRFAG